MIILQGWVLGKDTFVSSQIFPSASDYNEIKIYGDTTIDNVWVVSREFSDADIQSFLGIPEPPVWDGYTLAMFLFDNNLSGGNVTGATSPVTNWDVYRMEVGDTTTTKKLTTVSSSVGRFTDATAQNGKSYKYQLFGYNDSERTAPIESDIVVSSFGNCVLSSLDGSVNFVFYINSNLEAFGNEIDTTRNDGFGQYSQFVQGDRDFRTGSIQAIISSDYLDIKQTPEFIKSLRDFVNNKTPKILKTKFGDVLKVVTPNGLQTSIVENDSSIHYNSVKIDFAEVGVL